MTAPPESANHLGQLARVYSPVTWDLYAELDQSLQPRSPDWLLDRAADVLPEGGSVLDAGCRDAAYLIRLVQRCGGIGVGIDPVAIHAARAREAVEAQGLTDRIVIVQGVMDEAPMLGRRFDLVWCRDVLEQVANLDSAVAGMAGVLGPEGHIVVFTTVATPLLEPVEWKLLGQHLGNVSSNLVEANVQAAFRRAGLVVQTKDVIGTEWREYTEERTQPVSTALLRLARLRRSRDSVVARTGQAVFGHLEANLHWELFQFLGKLQPIVYILRSDQTYN